MIVRSPFGKTLQAMRENAQRAESVGIPVRRVSVGHLCHLGIFFGRGRVLVLRLQ